MGTWMRLREQKQPSERKVLSSYTRERKDLQNYSAGFFPPCEASKRRNALCLTSFDNDAGRKKDKLETANLFAHEYII